MTAADLICTRESCKDENSDSLICESTAEYYAVVLGSVAAWAQVKFEIYEEKIQLLKEKDQILEKELKDRKAQSQDLWETWHVQSKGLANALVAQAKAKAMSGLVSSDVHSVTPLSASAHELSDLESRERETVAVTEDPVASAPMQQKAKNKSNPERETLLQQAER